MEQLCEGLVAAIFFSNVDKSLGKGVARLCDIPRGAGGFIVRGEDNRLSR